MQSKKKARQAEPTMGPTAPALYSPERYEPRWRLSHHFNPTLETLRVDGKKRFKVLITDESLDSNGIQKGDYVIFEQTEEIIDRRLMAIETPEGVKAGYVTIKCDEREARLRIWYPTCGYPTEYFRPEEILILGHIVGFERDGKEYVISIQRDPTKEKIVVTETDDALNVE